MRLSVAPIFVAVLAFAGCDLKPSYVETSAEVDVFIAQNRWSAVCVALKNDRQDNLRRYTTQKIIELGSEIPEAIDCACKAVMDWPHGPYDEFTLEGMKGSRRDDLTECALPALQATQGGEQEKRIRLVTQIGAINSSLSQSTMLELLNDKTEDPAVRATAARGLTSVRDTYRTQLLERFTEDESPEVRAEIADVFANDEDETVVASLVKAAREDADGGVRAAALKSVVKLRLEETDAMVCDLMMSDPDERVRNRAVRSFKGSRRKLALDCLKKRLMTEEPSAMVRESTMVAIYSSPPGDYANKILCDAVGPFVRMYVDEVPVHKQPPGADILKHQNNRDYPNTHDCAKRALRQGGHSCWGRWYLADWVEQMGGDAHKPTCKGMEEPAVITFE